MWAGQRAYTTARQRYDFMGSSPARAPRKWPRMSCASSGWSV